MPIIPIQSPDDDRIAPYRNMRDRELAAYGNLFIAEGEYLVRRLMKSHLKPHSILVTPQKVDEIMPLAPADCPVCVAGDAIMNDILGFRFHSGIIACAKRPPQPTLDQIMDRTDPKRTTLIVCPEIHNSENIGSIIRIAAAFGANAIILGERSCDPWWRRSVRVSMGAVFFVPVVRSNDLTHDLAILKEQWETQLIATVVNDPEAEAFTHAAPRPKRHALLVGSESQGLSAHWVRQCDRRLTIPMHESTDSLNVAIAAAIFLWHFTQSDAPPPANLAPIPNPPRHA